MKIYYQLATSALTLAASALSLLMYTPTPSDSHPLPLTLLSHPPSPPPPQRTAGLNCHSPGCQFSRTQDFLFCLCVEMILINLTALCVTLSMGQKG